MKESEQEQALIFFAYQSNRGKAVDENINAIKYAIENFNKHQKNILLNLGKIIINQGYS